MKYMILRWAAHAVTAIVIIATKDLPGWLWGIILGAILVAFAISWQVITAKETEAKELKEYELFKAEMEARTADLHKRWDDNGKWIGPKQEF